MLVSKLKKLPTMAEWSIRTRQVFLSDRLVSQAKRVSKKSAGVLTYLVNAIEKKKDKNESALIPYSMISAVEPQSVDFLQGDWEDDSIALNQWAAHDLNASPWGLYKLVLLHSWGKTKTGGIFQGIYFEKNSANARSHC